jgi:hypothetical protein
LFFSSLIYSQDINWSFKSKEKYHLHKTDNTPVIGMTALLIASIVNPIVIYENKKIYLGISREVTLGFGKNNPFRISGEFSYIFREESRAQFRASIKYNILQSSHRGEFINSTSFLSLGAGYYTDKTGKGVFPELTAGFIAGADGFLFIPYLRFRHTIMITKDKPNVTDFSLGAAIGYHLF